MGISTTATMKVAMAAAMALLQILSPLYSSLSSVWKQTITGTSGSSTKAEKYSSTR